MKTTINILLAILSISIFSCQKAIEVPLPEDRILSSDMFTSDSKGTSAMTAVYGNMINTTNTFSSSLVTAYAGLSSDELKRFNPSSVFQEFMNNQLTVSNTQVKNIWSSAYKNIYYVNAIIEGLNSSNQITPLLKQQLLAECRFVRAFNNFYLVNIFGDVPLVTSTDYQVNSTIARTPMAGVYNSIVEDLKVSATDLPASYANGEKTRPINLAANALLARVYLYMGDWANAEKEANTVIASNVFTPLQAVNLSFLKASKEAIWQLAPTNGYLQETRLMKPSGTTPQIFLDNAVVNGFEAGDQRRTKWLDSITYQSVKYYLPGKYKNSTTTVTEYYVMLRVAETYLIRAEARAKLNSIANAIGDINAVRARAGISNLPTTLNQAQLFSALEQERRSELFGEWAHRWFDLKRTGRATTVLAPLKSQWQPEDMLYPIPLDEILTNSNLSQNPGY